MNSKARLRRVYDGVSTRFRQRRLAQLAGPVTGEATLRLGSVYGGWVVPESIRGQDGLALLAGVGEDTTFEEQLLTETMLTIVSVDPTPRAIAHFQEQSDHERWSMRTVGLWSSSGSQRFYEPQNSAHVSHSIVNLQETEAYFEANCSTVGDLLEVLGCGPMQLLKIDIEGAEFEVLGQMTEDGILPPTICVEFDQPCPIRRILGEIDRLRGLGYSLLAIDGWNVTMQHRSMGR